MALVRDATGRVRLAMRGTGTGTPTIPKAFPGKPSVLRRPRYVPLPPKPTIPTPKARPLVVSVTPAEVAPDWPNVPGCRHAPGSVCILCWKEITHVLERNCPWDGEVQA